MFIGIFSEILGGNERLRKKATEVIGRVAEFLARDLDAGIAENAFRPMDTMAVSYALIGIAEIVGNRYLMEEDFDVIQFFMNLMDFMQHGLSPDASAT